MPDRRHLVANRDRRHHDFAPARRHHHQARVGHPRPARASPPSCWTPKERSIGKGGGFLVLTEPWPSMLRTLYGDDARYQETYWSRFPGKYFAGDGAKLDEDGYWWVLGRVDDVLERGRPPDWNHGGRERVG